MSGATVQSRTLTRAVRAAAEALQEAAEELGALDSFAGDGDHGMAMEAAATKILGRLDEADDDVDAVLALVGEEFAAVGGSMGALLSVVFDDLRDAVAVSEAGDGRAVVAYLGVVREALTSLGGAEPGDKTIVDAVASAQDAATLSEANGGDRETVIGAAAEGARAGAESTFGMVARIGRASRLGERSRGYVDAGARSFALVLGAVAEQYQQGEQS